MLESNFTKDKIEVGVDEVGRGCLAGPVIAAAVILPRDFSNDLLNDSKKLTDSKRNQLYPIIKEEALAWGIGIVDNVEIDKINILNATYKAMHLAIDQLKVKPELMLIDGNRFKTNLEIPYECIVKGDGKFLSIAAASILAKVYRDDLMVELAEKHPYYDWGSNKGYPTKKHRAGIKEYGLTDLHRKSFKLLPDQLELFSR